MTYLPSWTTNKTTENEKGCVKSWRILFGFKNKQLLINRR